MKVFIAKLYLWKDLSTYNHVIEMVVNSDFIIYMHTQGSYFFLSQ